MSSNYELTYISLGAGWQSSAMFVCSQLGLHGVPRADVAIFADTGDEPQSVYDYIDVLKRWSLRMQQEGRGEHIPIITVSKGYFLSQSVVDKIDGKRKRFTAFPAYARYVEGGGKAATRFAHGMLRRQCTREFKIEPIEKEVRRLLGYKPRQPIKGVRARALVGISLDEVTRMKPSRVKWIENAYPLVEAKLRRDDCRKILLEQGLPEPTKSACIFCPYRSDKSWLRMREHDPKSWKKCVDLDAKIRDSTRWGSTSEVFLHRSCVPLDQVKFRGEQQMELFDNECEGMCGL